MTEFQSSLSSPGTLLTSFFTFLSSSPCLKILSNLKTGQAQVEWSEPSHDLNCEFYRSWQTPEITRGNYFDCGQSSAGALLLKHCHPPRLRFHPSRSSSPPRASEIRLKVMGHDCSVTGRALTEFERAH